MAKEPLDRNKTNLTHKVTAVAAAYLSDRGFKPIETEVSVREGWIADLASFVYPSNTEIRKLRLFGKRKIIDEYYQNEDMFLRHYGAPLTALVEVKTSLSDFRRDKKFDGCIFPAHLCYLAYPKGLLEKPPTGWIGLIVKEDGSRLLRIDIGGFWVRIHPQHPGDVTDLVANVAIRLLHRTRYAQYRAWLKAYRAGK